MNEQITIEMLPADYGDSLLVECRRDDEVHRILIDGGTPRTAKVLRGRLGKLPRTGVDLLVVSHLDADHIGGIVELLGSGGWPVDFGDIWFNGFQHLPLPPGQTRGFEQAETLTAALTGITASDAMPWNRAWSGGAVVRDDDHHKTGESMVDPPEIKTDWGATITLLSPTPKRLSALARGWQACIETVRRGESSPQTFQARTRSAEKTTNLEGLAASPSKPDDTPPNGSSIAFLLEFGGRSCLFAADAFATVLAPSLTRMALRRGVDRLEVDVLKLPHHGSQGNVPLGLFKVVRAKHYLVSTNSARFKHPDDASMARVITRGGPDHTIWFNYASERTLAWRDDALQARYGYRVEYPKSADAGVVLTI